MSSIAHYYTVSVLYLNITRHLLISLQFFHREVAYIYATEEISPNSQIAQNKATTKQRPSALVWHANYFHIANAII